MKVLVVGGGGREHALVFKIRKSPLVSEVYCAPGNAGIARHAECVPLKVTDTTGLSAFAERAGIDLTVVGPELPMVLGLGDEFQRRGLPIFCPTKAAAEIEGSKVFAREFMARHLIPSPGWELCESPEEAHRFIDRAPFGFPMVVKADGLAAGKGAVVAMNEAEARDAVTFIMTDRQLGSAGSRVVMEEFLAGEEVSFLVFSDGDRAIPMVSVQDHKRAKDGDLGPNTGGMGTVSPSPHLTNALSDEIMQTIILPSLRGMRQENRRFQGVLYAGLMITAKGPKVLEFNARFGDPETQCIMLRLRSDIVPLLLGVAQGALGDVPVEWREEAAACVVLASRGYPDQPETHRAISGLATLEDHADVVAFHAATVREGAKILTSGGRVLGVTALGPDLEAAIARAYRAVAEISFEGMQYRTDIGQRALRTLRGAPGTP
jgi:phosphoribosylamine--glycine ligase